MKVLMQSRRNFTQLPGGDTVQLLKTKTELEKLGVTVDLSLELSPDLSNYDLVHLSNLTRVHETYMQLLNAKKQNKPVVLSTIFWPMDEFEKNGQIGLRRLLNKKISIDNIEKIKAVAKYVINKSERNAATKNILSIGYTNMQRYIIENTDVFLPNSEMEMQKLCETFSIFKNNYIVVPNGIDSEIARSALSVPEFEEFKQFKDAVICVGRIETRKNQLALVKALEKTNYKLILVGSVSKNQFNYFKKVKQYIDKNENYYYIPRIENKKLYQLYKMCKVSTLPSWLDTPGLVSLEAAAMGCSLAVSSKGSTKEYFQDKAFYCLPDNLASIRLAVDNAFNNSDNTLQSMIFEKYTWKKAAQQTLKAYEKALKIC